MMVSFDCGIVGRRLLDGVTEQLFELETFNVAHSTLSLAHFASGARRIGREFGKANAGNLGITVGLVGTALVATTGAAVDYRRATLVQTVMQSAADAAVIGALKARGVTDEERNLRATDLFKANVSNEPTARNVVPEVTIGNGTAQVVATIAYPTLILKAVGMPSINVTARSSAVSKGRKVEMAMMTDITGSMDESRNGQRKIDGLKLAAKDLLDIVLPDGTMGEEWRVALIPFANYVNAGSRSSAVTGLAPTRNNYGVTEYLITCVTERTGSKAYTDDAPGPSAWIGAPNQGRSTANYDNNGGCDRSGGGGSGPMAEVMPLTADKAALLAQIDSFTPGGSTAGHLGTAWAWYALSPSWNSVWSLSTPAAPYSDQDTMKVAVLLTDGEYNTQYSGTDSKTQALAVCDAMKAAGIKVFTVGFGFDPGSVGDDAARDTLTRCASGTGHYFFPYDGDALRQVFQQIGDHVTSGSGKVSLTQ